MPPADERVSSVSGSRLRNLLRAVRHAFLGVAEVPRLAMVRERVDFLGREVARLKADGRRAAWQADRRTGLEEQTKASFDFQWDRMPQGAALPSDAAFMSQVAADLPRMVRVPSGWFAGKRVLDAGCGIGRYTRGLLQLGARVTACDQSEAALRRTADLCQEFSARLTLKRIDLLHWNESAAFDLAFSFGVVHHTGNTYLAMENVCRKVGIGGRVFFMIYAVPDTLEALREVNAYERLASEIRDLSFEARKDFVERRFGTEKAHGWFDALSPRINDRLTFEEIHDVLKELGFDHITSSVVLRNHYVTADRVRAH